MRVLWILVAYLALIVAESAEKKIVCYFPGGPLDSLKNDTFNISNFNPSLCTHLVYVFAAVEDGDIQVVDASRDLPDDGGLDAFGRVNALRQKNPNLKTMIGIGEWGLRFAQFSQIARSSESRDTFADNVVKFVKKWGFDGCELKRYEEDKYDRAPQDIDNHNELLKALRTRFDSEGLILSAFANAAESYAVKTYNISEMIKYLDFVNLAAYSFHDFWEMRTGLYAPLHASSSDTEEKKKLTVEASIDYWLSQGAPKEKLIVGVSLFGRNFTLANSTENGVGAAIGTTDPLGFLFPIPGTLAYNQICKLHKEGGWTVVFDEERREPYSFKGDQWISYENVKSIKDKAEYVVKMNLGGIALTTIEMDDFRGICGVKYPLLNTVNEVLRHGSHVVEEPQSAEVSTIRPKSVSEVN